MDIGTCEVAIVIEKVTKYVPRPYLWLELTRNSRSKSVLCLCLLGQGRSQFGGVHMLRSV